MLTIVLILGEQMCTDEVALAGSGWVPDTNTERGLATDTAGISIFRVKSYVSPRLALAATSVPMARVRVVSFHSDGVLTKWNKINKCYMYIRVVILL